MNVITYPMKSLDILKDVSRTRNLAESLNFRAHHKKARHRRPSGYENERMDESHNERYIEAEQDSAKRTGREQGQVGYVSEEGSRGKVSAGTQENRRTS